MGLSYRYTFAPSLDPQQVLTQAAYARSLIQDALECAAAALEANHIPYEIRPPRYQMKGPEQGNIMLFDAALLLGGPALGCEPLTLGWGCWPPEKWTGLQFLKTQYARDFRTAHPALGQVLADLEAVGYIGAVHDEAGHYQTGQSMAELTAVYAASMAQAGQVHDLLQNLSAEYQAPTPGGAIKAFGPPPETRL